MPCGHVNSDSLLRDLADCCQLHQSSLPAQVSLEGQPQYEARQLPSQPLGVDRFLPVDFQDSCECPDWSVYPSRRPGDW